MSQADSVIENWLSVATRGFFIPEIVQLPVWILQWLSGASWMIVAQIQVFQMGGVGAQSWGQRGKAFLCDQTYWHSANPKNNTCYVIWGDTEVELSGLLSVTSINNPTNSWKQTLISNPSRQQVFCQSKHNTSCCCHTSKVPPANCSLTFVAFYKTL